MIDARNRTNQIYALLAYSLAIWNFGEMMMKVVPTAAEAQFWDKIASTLLGWCFLGPFFLHFILSFTKKDKLLANKWFLLALYAPSFLWVYLKLFTNYIHSGVVRVYWGWDVIVEPGFSFYTIHLITLFFIGFVIAFSFWLSSKNKLERLQAKIIAWGTFVPFTAGIATEALLPILGIHFIRLAGIYSTIFALIIAYAISRYQLLQMSPEKISGNILASISDFLWLIDSKFKITYVNQSTLNLLGYNRSELLDRPTGILFSRFEDFESLITEKNNRVDVVSKAKKTIPVMASCSIVLDRAEEAIGYIILAKDITDQKRAEERIEHLSAILRSISKINELIIKEKDQDRLLNTACQILTESRGHRLVWIGLIKEGSYDVFPAAQAGFEDGYLKSVRITWDNSPTGQGPTGMAIKTGQPNVMQDISTDPRFAPWREPALKRGYSSSIALPLKIDDQVLGVLNIYSDAPRAFGEDEIDLLSELAGDIAFGMHTIKIENEQKQAEQKIREHLKELQVVADAAVGRELKMIELEKEINALLVKSGQEPKYQV